MKAAGKDAIRAPPTGVCMMFIAAPIEGFFSFNPHVPGRVEDHGRAHRDHRVGAFWVFYGRSEEVPG